MKKNIKILSIALIFAILSVFMPIDQILISAEENWLWPIATSVSGSTTLSRGYWYNSSSDKHAGVDIKVGKGTQVMASKSGTIYRVYTGCGNEKNQQCSSSTCGGTAWAGRLDGYCGQTYGNAVIIEHADKKYSIYGHLSAVYVTEGMEVTQGTVIGLSGTTGHSTNYHLHFQITKENNNWSSNSINNNPKNSGFTIGNIKTDMTQATITYSTVATAGGTPTPYQPQTVSTNPDDYPFPTRNIYHDSSAIMKGDDVKWIQAVLYQLGYGITVDGSYGSGTTNIVKQFQQNNGLEVDGRCGPATRTALLNAWNYKKNGGYNPQGCVDNIIGETGSVFVSGWAFDADNLPEALYLLVYIEGEYAGTVLANTPRTDVDDVYHVGAFHGFEASITTDKTGYHEVAVYALNLGGGDGVVIGYKTVYIAPRHTHSYGDWQVVTHATCTTSGSSKRVCSCGDVETRIDAATGHSWNSGEIIANAGCTAGGLKKYTCSMCDATITEVISAFGHTPVIDNAIAATCTEDGITEGSHCAVCDAIIKPQQTVTALGHDDKIISVKKSCDFVVATYKCTRCGETYDGDKKERIEFDWSESKPQGIDDSLIEKKTQYSYRDKTTKTSDNSSLSGWTLDYSTWVWSDYGAWSGWSDGPYYASDSRQIDTQTVVASYNYKTVWHYYCYSSNANLTGGTSYYPTSKYGYNKYSFDFEEELSPTGKTYTYNGYTMVQYKWWYSNTNYHHVYAVYPGEAPYQYTTQEIASTNYKTQYRYRDRNQIYTYYYYKWSDFSDWSDTEYIANENRQVKTRILYKFSIIPIGHLYSTSWGFDEQSHWHKCENCGVLSNLSHHAGGTASCNQKAICEICGVEYGDYNTHAHKFGNEGICENCGIHLGDANADGKIDAKDLALIITAILTDADYDEILDTNGNEKIDLLDIVKLKKYLIDNSVTLGKS